MPNLYHQKAPVFSCELFPPKSSAARSSLLREIPKLLTLPFSLFTVTHGACGSYPEGTPDTISLLRDLGLEPQRLAGHLCCRGETREGLRARLDALKSAGAEWIVALRGDRPQGESPKGFQHASELVSLLREEYAELGVAVAGYPEIHPEALSADSDLDFLRRKVDCGAQVVYTQFFFENESFFRFRDRCLRAGISVPIVPGLLPVQSLEQVERLSQKCGARVPQSLRSGFGAAKDQGTFALDFSRKQAVELLEGGAAGLHFYCLNKADFVLEVFQAIGVET